MAARWHTITDQARRALTRHARFDGARVTITDQLQHHEWRQVRDVLERLGGEFAPRTSSFDLPPGTDAATTVAAALAAGRVMAASAADGYVPTPSGLASDLVDAAGMLLGPSGRALRVLEPSAGTGRFVTATLDYPGVEVVAVEPDALRAARIPPDPRVTVVTSTFETYTATNPGRFDRVVMNPPFSVPGHPQLWAEHLKLAWRTLTPGGRLVAVLPASAIDSNRTHRGPALEVAALIRQHGGGEFLPEDAFSESGIMVPTCVVWLDRPPTPAPDGGPVTVDRLYRTPAAARTVPVQAMYCGWRGRTRTVRYRGDCTACGQPTWGFDDGDNDPRGPLGDQATDPLRAADYDKTGPDVPLCFGCGNDGDTYRRALAAARETWATPRPPTPVPAARQEPTQMDLLDLTGAAS